ncbi:endogenous retrovirus group K member 18 Env polyprotein [Talpa occidentalis]|uniref:endogenous retrovirus group K member 18 Env polyprotein n=1 Tax=Talpa occidentalis TaxID=50954 RepID=UPI00188E30CD|nr:endogenous retrovirus group K member 18 Env polyprotein [Talpa occidentalis]XP_054548818.1 endogenous retrovirus group K member 18 Env polyprotein [Talpa occidentalis]
MTPCIPIVPQTWVNSAPPIKINNQFGSQIRTLMDMYVALSFNFTEINTTSKARSNKPVCQQISYKNYTHSPTFWSQCRGLKGIVLRSGKYVFVDWGPHGKFLTNCSEDYSPAVCDYVTNAVWNVSKNGTVKDRNQYGLMAWHDGGMAPPRPRLSLASGRWGPEQWDFWKLIVATTPMQFWKGSFSGTSRSGSHYHFVHNTSFYIRACVRFPYVIAIGTVSFDEKVKAVTCNDCSLYSCVNSSAKFNISRHSLLVLKARTHLWLPVNPTRPWEESPVTGTLLRVIGKLLRRAGRFVGWLVPATLGLTAVTATAAAAGAALHTAVQAHDFVATWSHDSPLLWRQQVRIDEDLQARVGSYNRLFNGWVINL